MKLVDMLSKNLTTLNGLKIDGQRVDATLSKQTVIGAWLERIQNTERTVASKRLAVKLDDGFNSKLTYTNCDGKLVTKNLNLQLKIDKKDFSDEEYKKRFKHFLQDHLDKPKTKITATQPVKKIIINGKNSLSEEEIQWLTDTAAAHHAIMMWHLIRMTL